MSEVAFLEDSLEISTSYSDSWEVEDLSFVGCDFQTLQPYHFEPEKQNQANSFQCDHSPEKVGEKTHPSFYKIMLETLGSVNVWNVMQRPEELTVLDELKFEGKLFYVIF